MAEATQVSVIATKDSLVVSRSIETSAPPNTVFTLLANPTRHLEFDGSGSVLGVVEPVDMLVLGSRFDMRMKRGIPYKITNLVVEFEPDRLIAWRHLGRHRWRYELEALPSGGTRIIETFDGSTSVVPWALHLMGAARTNAAAIEATLPRLAAASQAAALSPDSPEASPRSTQ